MKSNLVSIVMPIYNAEANIRQSIDSVLGQTYKNIELILIDDGSTDSSGKICDEFAAKDDRVIVRHTQNFGPAAARNLALDIASGEYVSFCDSDDIYEARMCEKMVEALKKRKVDLVLCDFLRFGTDQTKRFVFGIPNAKIVKRKPQGGLFNIVGVVWNKLFKRELIEKYHIRFPETKTAEDLTFYLEYALVSKKAYVLHEKLYHYRVREDSLMSQYGKDSKPYRYDHFNNWCTLVDFARRVGMLEYVAPFLLERAKLLFAYDKDKFSEEEQRELWRKYEERFGELKRRSLLRRILKKIALWNTTCFR